VGVTTFEGEQENETATVAACANPWYQIAIGAIGRVDPDITVLLKLIY
jgi:GDPmannose 4,6-dehydratase